MVYMGATSWKLFSAIYQGSKSSGMCWLYAYTILIGTATLVLDATKLTKHIGNEESIHKVLRRGTEEEYSYS